MPVPNPIQIYRMIHWQNVEHILQHGLCCREHPNADPNYINIGHAQLIEDRHEHTIPLDGAGNLGEYIPFYFAGHSPMLYIMKNGYLGVEQRPQSDIVYIVSNVDQIEQEGLEFVFTDRNAKLSLARFFNKRNDFAELDWNIIQSKSWINTDREPLRKDLKQAEFLVRNEMPVSSIESLVVKTNVRKSHFDNMIARFGLRIPVFVDNQSKLYY